MGGGAAALAGKKEDVRNRHDGLMRRHRSDAISPPELSRVTALMARRMTTISPEERRMTHRAAMTFRDVEGVLHPFSGDDDHDVRKWSDEFEDTAELCEWSDMHQAIYARKLLRGSAKLFVGYEDCKHSWGLLKEALLREFSPRIDSHVVHRKLQQRRKKSNESYHEYCYKMLEIGSQVKMDMSAVTQYIIDGVDGDDVNKIVLYGAQNITQLKLKLDVFERMKNKGKGGKTDSSQKGVPDKNSNAKAFNQKCFNCGNSGHLSRDCPSQKNGPKCFRCNQFGHKSQDCQKQVNAVDVQKINFTKCHKTVTINGVKMDALIDTGSDISILRVDRFAKIGAPTLEKTITQFKGIGSGSLFTLGTTNVKMMIDDECFCANLHVVSEKPMEHELFSGNDFLRGVEMRCKGGEEKILKLTEICEESEILKIDCVAEINRIDVSHVKDERIRNEVERMIDEYEPEKTPEIDMKVRIILKDDVPVSQSARRLAHSEKAAVYEQIETWTQEKIVRPSISDYASPIVLVKKKDGSNRIIEIIKIIWIIEI